MNETSDNEKMLIAIEANYLEHEHVSRLEVTWLLKLAREFIKSDAQVLKLLEERIEWDDWYQDNKERLFKLKSTLEKVKNLSIGCSGGLALIHDIVEKALETL